jgi:hypothetical protein
MVGLRHLLLHNRTKGPLAPPLQAVVSAASLAASAARLAAVWTYVSEDAKRS